MDNLESMSQQELEDIANNLNLNNKPIKEKKGLFGLFKKNKKMVEEKTNENKQEVVQEQKIEEQKIEEPQQEKSVEEVKEDVEEIKEEVKQSGKDLQNSYDNVEKTFSETLNEEPYLKEINNGNKEQIIERVMSRQSFNEKSDYKIATFQIKVKNENVGSVLTKLGGYADELNELEQVEHCDLTIIDRK